MKKKFKITYNAPVILSFTILCFVVTILGIMTNGKSTEAFFSIYRGSFGNPMTYIRCFTHVLGHADFQHLMGNAMYLLLLGPMLEEKYGSNVIVKVIIVTAFVTGVINCLLWKNTALCGASGIVFAFIVLASITSFKYGEIPLSFVLVFFVFVGNEVYNGIIRSDDVANLSHILGGLVGSIYGIHFNRRSI